MRYCLVILALIVGFLIEGCADAPVDDNSYSAPPAVGAIAPNFTQNDTSGNPVSLSKFSGKVVLLDFWATWCAPCMQELPNVRALWQKYQSKGLVILSVSLDTDLDTWRAVIHINKLDWVHVADGKFWSNAVARQYGVTAIPQMYLVGRDGKVIAGGYVLDEQAIADALQ